MLELIGNNLDISKLFNDYITRSVSTVYNNSFYDYGNNWYNDDYDDDYYGDWYDSSSSDLGEDISNVTIYFYHDIKKKEDVLVFNNINDFDEFLSDECIYVTSYEFKKLRSRIESHCCIDPYGDFCTDKNWLISDCSYGGLSWSVCGDSSYDDEYNVDNFPF